jgi:hypothetical protein
MLGLDVQDLCNNVIICFNRWVVESGFEFLHGDKIPQVIPSVMCCSGRNTILNRFSY